MRQIAVTGSLLLAVVLGGPSPSLAQQQDTTRQDALDVRTDLQKVTASAPTLAEGSSSAVLPLTIEEAVEIALVRNYALRNNRLDLENAEEQVRQAWGRVLPQVSTDASYTRNVVTANPFAGSDVTGLFAGGNAADWVAFNERARTDDDPSSEPITFAEFQRRQQQGRQDAGIKPGGISSNPFSVANQFQGGLTISQVLFNGSAFANLAGAQELRQVNRYALNRQQQIVVDSVRQTYYSALLAAEQVQVTAQRVERTEANLQEVSRQVKRGVAPKFQRVSAEVELTNLRTQLVQQRDQARLALDNLKFVLGFPVEQPIRLQGGLRAEDTGQPTRISTAGAVDMALENRPDLARARLAVDLREIDQRAVQAEYLPTVSAVANFNYSGRVPDADGRVRTFMPDPSDPFTFERQTSGFFADEFWNPSVNVGLQLSWSLFDGFQRSARIEQRQVAVNRARLQLLQLRQGVRLQVQSALRRLRSARRRIQSQQANVERAQLNYEYAQKRLSVGAANQLQLREASDQLDQARLGHLQAVYDYLTARSAFETAVGMPMDESSLFRFTRAPEE